MKKLIPLALIATLGISGIAIAKPHYQGGFHDGTTPKTELNTGKEISITTVEQAKQLPDDTKVTLKGHIIKQINEKKYLFKDDSGEIQIEIHAKGWKGQTVTPSDAVQIMGKVDKDSDSVEIEVRKIKIIPIAVTN